MAFIKEQAPATYIRSRTGALLLYVYQGHHIHRPQAGSATAACTINTPVDGGETQPNDLPPLHTYYYDEKSDTQ